MKTSTPPQHSFPLMLILTFVVLAAAILTGGYSFYFDQEQLVRRNIEDALLVVARFKTNQVVQWRTERLGDTTVIMENTITAIQAAQWLAAPTPELTETLTRWLRSIQEAYSYRNVLLVDAQGSVRLSVDQAPEPVAEATHAALVTAFREHRALITDLYQPADGNPPRLDLVAPLFISRDGGQQPVGAVILDVDARQFLYPLIQSWPVPRGSAETLLVEREHNQVLFLNDLRYQQNTALKLRIPLSQQDLPAVQAVLGVTGIFTGRDYRGVEVVAALQPIPGTPWSIVAKQDAAEAFAAGRFRGRLILSLMAGLLVITLGGVSLVWQRRQSLHYRLLYETEVERRKAEARLEEQYVLLNAVLQGTSDAIVVKDLQGRYLLVNPAAEKIIGHPAAEVLGRDTAAFFPSEVAHKLAEADRLASATKPGETIATEHALTVDGQVRHYVIIKSALRDGAGKVTGQISVAHDITRRKRDEEAREELLRELQEKTVELEDLLYVSSHDLRSPLVNIQGFSQRLEKAATDLASLFDSTEDAESLRQTGRSIVQERMPTALHYIIASGQKMDALINGLLQTSRLGRFPIRLAHLDMNRLIATVRDAHAYQIEQSRAEIQIESLPPCWGDAVQINQAFANLVDNAIKYRDGNRPLRIRISGWEEDKRVVYCVEDSGQGIKPEHQVKIWRLFYRLEPGGTVAGEGLGLTTVRLIVQRHRGQVWLESEPGQGSRFFVALPRQKPGHNSTETEGRHEQRGNQV